VHAALHDLFSVGTFVGLPIACLVMARRFAGWGQRGWAIYSAATGLVFVAGFVLTSMAFNQVEPLVAFGGLFQRATITLGWTWLTLLAIHLLRGLPPHRQAGQPRRRGVDLDSVLAAGFALIGPHLTERQRRLLYGAFAHVLGHGGVTRIAAAATAAAPRWPAANASWPCRPTRPATPARRAATPSLCPSPTRGCWTPWMPWSTPDTRGDPCSPLRWTKQVARGSARNLGRQTAGSQACCSPRCTTEPGGRMPRLRPFIALPDCRIPDRSARQPRQAAAPTPGTTGPTAGHATAAPSGRPDQRG
jgi:Protein of unknown function (DUF998)